MARKLELALDLTSHSNPKRKIAPVMEAALDLLIDKLLNDKHGLTREQRRAVLERIENGDPAVDANAQEPVERHGKALRYVPRSVRRDVALRDGLQCAYVDPSGGRCEETAWLERDHEQPLALGGSGKDLRLCCRAHNQFEAEQRLGRVFMEQKRGLRVEDSTLPRYRAHGPHHPASSTAPRRELTAPPREQTASPAAWRFTQSARAAESWADFPAHLD